MHILIHACGGCTSALRCNNPIGDMWIEGWTGEVRTPQRVRMRVRNERLQCLTFVRQVTIDYWSVATQKYLTDVLSFMCDVKLLLNIVDFGLLPFTVSINYKIQVNI